jgi:hypothetical protein
MFRRSFLTLTLLVCTWQPSVIAQQSRGVLRIIPAYQHWNIEEGGSVGELSSTVDLQYAPSAEFSLVVRNSQAATFGTSATLRGLTDTQIGLAWRMLQPNVVFHLGVNVPSGSKRFTLEEFETSRFLSQKPLDFQVPNFGQGWNIQPGVTWAFPAADNVVIGAGISYQYTGRYRPLEDFGMYDSGDELHLSGGIDFRLTEASSVSLDGMMTTYGSDKFAGEPLLASGTRFLGKVRYLQTIQRSELTVFLKLVSKSTNELPATGRYVGLDESIEPGQVRVATNWRIPFNPTLVVGFLLDFQAYSRSSMLLSDSRIWSVGINPEMKVGAPSSLQFRIRYSSGTVRSEERLSGIEVGGGLSIDLP